MNDIFHERHMNNIIAADREQNIQVRPTTSTRISPITEGPKAIAGSSVGLVYAACRLVDLKFLSILRRTRGRTSTQEPHQQRIRSTWNQPGGPEARAGATPGTRRDPRNEALESLIFWCPFESEVAAQIRAPRLLCGCEREKQTWSMLMAVSSGTS
jgi:hypothetical protein